jgi:hypothetical protein
VEGKTTSLDREIALGGSIVLKTTATTIFYGTTCNNRNTSGDKLLISQEQQDTVSRYTGRVIEIPIKPEQETMNKILWQYGNPEQENYDNVVGTW